MGECMVLNCKSKSLAIKMCDFLNDHAAHLFTLLKHSNINAELITKYVKDWVWEGRQIQPGDQYYILTKQMRRERIKFKDVDAIVTDAPIWLSCIYKELNEPKPHISKSLIDK